MKIYWTKYALTKGIIELDVELTRPGVYKSDEYYMMFFFESNKKEWYKTKDAALIQAEIMREKKLVSIEKQKTKIENIDFESQVK